MKCPCCGKELTVGEELLYKIEQVYYCPHCLVKITNWPDRKLEVEGRREKVELRKVKERG